MIRFVRVVWFEGFGWLQRKNTDVEVKCTRLQTQINTNMLSLLLNFRFRWRREVCEKGKIGIMEHQHQQYQHQHQHNTIQHNTIQHNTIQHNTTQYNNRTQEYLPFKGMVDVV